jgi:hypothetical protein
MSKLFYVDWEGNFKIVVNQLTNAQSTNKNGTFLVPIKLTDLQGYSQYVNVIVQLSILLQNNRCPKISENADCKYYVNRTLFVPSSYRLLQNL